MDRLKDSGPSELIVIGSCTGCGRRPLVIERGQDDDGELWHNFWCKQCGIARGAGIMSAKEAAIPYKSDPDLRICVGLHSARVVIKDKIIAEFSTDYNEPRKDLQ